MWNCPPNWVFWLLFELFGTQHCSLGIVVEFIIICWISSLNPLYQSVLHKTDRRLKNTVSFKKKLELLSNDLLSFFCFIDQLIPQYFLKKGNMISLIIYCNTLHTTDVTEEQSMDEKKRKKKEKKKRKKEKNRGTGGSNPRPRG